jgi:hypothetical protein
MPLLCSFYGFICEKVGDLFPIKFVRCCGYASRPPARQPKLNRRELAENTHTHTHQPYNVMLCGLGAVLSKLTQLMKNDPKSAQNDSATENLEPRTAMLGSGAYGRFHLGLATKPLNSQYSAEMSATSWFLRSSMARTPYCLVVLREAGGIRRDCDDFASREAMLPHATETKRQHRDNLCAQLRQAADSAAFDLSETER